MDANELQRQARNAVRKGSILDIDHERALCRVSIGESRAESHRELDGESDGAADEDGLQTNWIPWLTAAAGGTREWLPPTKGEQVILLCPMGDPAQAVALHGFFSIAAPAPDTSPSAHTRIYPDGARISYDHAKHTLSARLPEGASVDIDASVSVTVKSTKVAIDATDVTLNAANITLNAESTTCNGALLVKGALAFEAGMTGKGGGGGGSGTAGAVMKIDGSAHFAQDVTAGGVSLINHAHQAQGERAITSEPKSGAA